MQKSAAPEIDPLGDIDFDAPKIPPTTSLETLAAALDYELIDKEWFVTGRVNPIYFSDEFEFQDPDVQLKVRFSSTSGQNFGKYNSSVVDDLLREAGETGNLSTRRAKYTQLAAVIMADLPYLWIHQNYFGVLHSSKVRNLPPFNEADLGAFRIGAVNKTR
jgi:ABC-type transport system substrate-binding protein